MVIDWLKFGRIFDSLVDVLIPLINAMEDNRRDGELNPVDIGIIGGGKGGSA